MIKYIKGDCLKNSEQVRIIAHIVNNRGEFGKGFALSVAKKYPTVADRYKAWYYIGKYKSSKFNLGDIQPIRINYSLSVVNMLAQNGYRSNNNPVPLDYKALEKCLRNLKAYNKDRIPIWMPKIGSGLGGGDWKRIQYIINTCFSEQDVVIFEL